jgi:hypothetical protein
MPTIITDAGAVATTAGEAEFRDGTVLAHADALPRLVGWELKPEGLCRGDVCVPTRTRPDVLVGDRVDLAVVAALMARPFVVDTAFDGGVAVFGESAAARGEQLAARHVDDFELTDAFGDPFRWSSLGRKKKVLVAWASW